MAAAVVFLGIEKTGSQVFFLSLTPLMRPYIVKITWSRPKMPCPHRILFLFGSLRMRRRNFTSWARKLYIAQKRFIMTLFL
jgi:hypothetical protein